MTVQKAPSKKKVPKLEEIRKPLIIGGIIAVLTITGLIVGITIYRDIIQEKPDVVVIIGVVSFPYTIDPIDATDYTDLNVIEQVAEGLFDIDLTSPNSEIINCLAINSEWSSDALNITCILRQGVKFHDGTQFNADAVKWNFDRLYRLRDIIATSYLWNLPDDRFLINKTQVLGDYTIRFVLNSPYAPLMSLLTSWSSYILSPTSTPEDRIMNTTYDDTLVGTGPFMYDNSYGSSDVNFSLTMPVNPTYWGDKPEFDELILISGDGDQEDLIPALKMKKLHLMMRLTLNESELDYFKGNSSFIVHEGIIDGRIDCLVINNQLINVTMRKAVSYAFNYSSYIETSPRDDRRAKSPIPERTLYYNVTGINYPIYNVSHARQILKDANWPGTELLTVNDNISAGNEWELKANSPTPLETYNYSQIISSSRYLGEQLLEDLKQIGVKIEIVNVTVFEFLCMVYDWPPYNRNMINFIYGFWIGDFNDPSIYLNPIYMNNSAENWGQVYDPQLQDWMEEALAEIDPIKRRNLYYDLQKYIIEEIYPSVWLTNSLRRDIYVSNLQGWYPNFYRISFKTLYFET